MQISSLGSKVIITDNLVKDLGLTLKDYQQSKIFIIVDENTKVHCLPVIQEIDAIRDAQIIETKSGEDNKSIETVIKIWDYLSNNGADRNSLVINLGGGLVGDMGGFAASTFKRGMDFINIPTTLLAQVDASIGGKLGINFCGLKNEVGVFKSPKVVIVDTIFLKTISHVDFASGFAEMIKHALIYSFDHWTQLKKVDLNQPDFKDLKKHISKSIFIKNDFVQTDFTEKNIRKALNFGHTFGHAFESFLIEKGSPVLHGEAVAHGMICELYCSHKKLGLNKLQVIDIIEFILKNYNKIVFSSENFEEFYQLMKHDKKNDNDAINFTLLSEIGQVEINKHVTKDEIFDSLNFYLKLQKDTNNTNNWPELL